MSSMTFIRRMALVLGIVALASTGCSKKEATPDETTSPTAPVATDENTLGDSDSGKAMGLQTVRFPYDSFKLDEEGKRTLKANADILKDKSSVKIQIEGHCDSRGGIQYNIALGEKRANAVKGYLQDAGIAADRLSTISYGKERPAAQGETEDAHAQNRRANFVITSR